MAERWAGSTRKYQLPSDWKVRRQRILDRDGHRCTWVDDGVRCGAVATQVDHVVRGLNHDDVNLRSLCEQHHKYKTAREGSAAGNAKRWSRGSLNRPPERHPGLR